MIPEAVTSGLDGSLVIYLSDIVVDVARAGKDDPDLTSGQPIFDFGISKRALPGALGRDERHSYDIVAYRRLPCHLVFDGAEQELFEAHAAQWLSSCARRHQAYRSSFS